jgi:hypothetical protein
VQIVQQLQESTNEEPRRGSRPRNATFLFESAHPAQHMSSIVGESNQLQFLQVFDHLLTLVINHNHAPEYGFKHSKFLLDTTSQHSVLGTQLQERFLTHLTFKGILPLYNICQTIQPSSTEQENTF